MARPDAERPATMQRSWGYAALFVSVFCAALLVWLQSVGTELLGFPLEAYLGVGAAFFAVAYFLIVCFWVLGRSNAAQAPDPLGILYYVLNSALLTILSVAALFRFGGLKSSNSPCVEPASWDTLYFSMVTFSTLGYGDFVPAGEWFRLTAGAAALIGNLHLGLLVGAVFYSLQGQSKAVDTQKNAALCPHCQKSATAANKPPNDAIRKGEENAPEPQVGQSASKTPDASRRIRLLGAQWPQHQLHRPSRSG
ncbi:MAG: ion channel [Pseudomonadota bacterium]